MRKFLFPLAMTAGGLLLVGVLDWLASFANLPLVQICAPQQNGQAAPENCAAYYPILFGFLSSSAAFFDEHNGAVTALATIVICYFTYTLWLVSDRQSQDNRALQRAYIAVIACDVEPFRYGDEEMATNVIFRNVGNLPARSVRWFITAKISAKSGLRENDMPIGTLIESMVVPPKVDATKGATTNALKTADFIAQRDAPGKPRWLYVYGRVQYDDWFGARWTNFCIRYNLGFAKQALGTELPASEARYHEYGNRTEEG